MIIKKWPKIIYLISIGILTLAALLIRMAYIEQTVIVAPIRADALQYVNYGHNLLHLKIYSSQLPKSAAEPPKPDSFRSPGYPLFMALAIYMGGEKGWYHTMLLFQAILGSLMVPLTYILATRMMAPLWAVTASALVCFSPHLVSMTSYLLTETLFGTVLLAAVLFFLFAVTYRKALLYAVAGVTFGTAYLVNETILFIPILLPAALWGYSKFKSAPFKTATIHTVTFLLCFTLFPLAWSIRNHISIAEDAPKASNRALNTLTHGTYPGFIYQNPAYKYFPYYEDPRQPEFSSSLNAFASILWDRIKERPLRYLSWYVVEKPYYLWSWNILQGQGDVYVYPVKTSLYLKSTAAKLTHVIMKVLHPLILIFSILGIILFFKGSAPLGATGQNEVAKLTIFIILIYYTLLYTLFAPWPRYSVPLRPFLYIWSLWSLKSLMMIASKTDVHIHWKLRRNLGID